MTTNTSFRKIITEIVDRILKGYKPKKVIFFIQEIFEKGDVLYG